MHRRVLQPAFVFSCLIFLFVTEGRGAAEEKLPPGASKVVFNFVQHMVVDAKQVFFTEGAAWEAHARARNIAAYRTSETVDINGRGLGMEPPFRIESH